MIPGKRNKADPGHHWVRSGALMVETEPCTPGRTTWFAQGPENFPAAREEAMSMHVRFSCGPSDAAPFSGPTLGCRRKGVMVFHLILLSSSDLDVCLWGGRRRLEQSCALSPLLPSLR